LTDQRRRWLDDSGIWSCRIKLPQPQPQSLSLSLSLADTTSRQVRDNTTTTTTTTTNTNNYNYNTNPNSTSLAQLKMAPTQSIDAVLDTGSPSSRRNKGKIAEAIQSLSHLNNGMDTLELPTDPDAQATVTDFLDFTEYLPADMIRSLTLVGNLDQIYNTASAALNDLTKQYGILPEMSADSRIDPVRLREDISVEVSQAVSARILSHAEAVRMDDNVGRHLIRAKNILAKLEKMAEEYPTSRDGSPKMDSPVLARSVPKITLRTDISRETGDIKRSRKHRAPRITVPGEVLAPYELDYESWGSESDSSESEDDRRIFRSPERAVGAGINKIKLKILKKDKKEKSEKPEKPPRMPRPPGAMGTNVHSAVAGISTSNALAKLKPPPPESKNGDEHKPWLALNPWELATLRKRMKKNAIWSPSDTMIARELASLGRGYENYLNAKAEAEEAGEDFPIPPQLRGEVVHTEGAISVDALKSKDTKLVNRGMKLNEAKKLKKENLAKQAAEEAALEAEAAAHKMTTLKSNMANMFVEQNGKDKKPIAKTPAKPSAKKRKRDSPVEEESQRPIPVMPILAAKPPLKRSKTETPVPVPQTIFAKQVSPINPPESATSPVPAPILTPTLETAPDTLILPLASPKKSSTPILPPTKDLKRAAKKEVKKPEPTPHTRSRRSEEEVMIPSSEAPPAKRPSSSRSKRASEEPVLGQTTVTSERPRRTSTARNTPAPPEPHKMNRRAKRPAPGVVTADSEGSMAVSVGKRSKATRKKAGARREKKDEREGSANHETFDEFDEEGNLIDPNEPRYCLCSRVSFGIMIECENKDVSIVDGARGPVWVSTNSWLQCEKEWFHLECVGLTQIPGKATKWYCPDCRVSLNLGPKGEVTSRGKKK